MNLKDIIMLIRVRQWYKNTVIFLPLIFGKELFNLFSIQQTFIGFLALCLVSSANYVVNDLVDAKRDRRNPEKKSRPIASRRVKTWQAVVMTLLLLCFGLYISYTLSLMFFVFALALFLSTQLYSFVLRNEPFADILMVAINFVIRTISGAFVITKGVEPYIEVSSWLILCPFFLALFLVISKRRAEAMFLKNKATLHRKVLSTYNEEMTSAMLVISTTLLISSYSLYTFFSAYHYLIFTLPLVLFIIFRFFHYAQKGLEIARHPELIYKEKGIMIAIFLTIIVAIFSIYL